MGSPTKLNGLEILNRKTSTGVDAAIVLPELSSAPSVTTNKLYNHNGVLYFDGVSLESGGGGGAVGSLNEAYENGAQITVDSGAVTLVDATTGSANTLFIQKNGAGSGALISLDLNTGIAAYGLYIDNGAGARTGSDIYVKGDSTGAHSVIDISAEGSGALVAFNYVGSYNGSPAGQVFKVTLDANDGLDTEVMEITTGAGNRGAMFDFNFGHTDSGTTSHIWDIDVSAILDSNIFDFATSAACTGNVFFVDLDNGVAMTALHVEGSGVRTQPMVEIATDATGSANLVTFVVAGAISGNVLDFSMATTSTGNVIDIDMDAAVGGKAIYIDSGNAIRTAALIDILHDGSGDADCINIDHSNTGAGHLIDVNVSGIGSGNVLDITYSAASTGDAISIVLANALAASAMVVTGAGVRTDDIFKVDDSSSSNSHVWDVNISGASTGNVLDIVMSGSKVAGHAINIDLGTDLAGAAMVINAAGVRTAPIFYIANAGTDAETDDHVFWINQTGLLDSNLVNLEFGTAASTGEAISISMGTNVAGRAVAITSAATGVSGEGAGLDITHTGDLVAGANLVDIISTGSPSSTSHVVSIQQTTGAGSAGAYALYINATGTNVEALRVDAGNVVFDERLSVIGRLTADEAVVFSGIETINAGGTSTALSLTKTVHHIDADAGGDTFTLADGTLGQIMLITMESSTGTATITPANFAGGTSVTFNAAGDSVILLFVDAKWYVIGGNSYAIV